MATTVALTMATLCAGVVLHAEERPVVVSDLKELAGEWRGSLTDARGGTIPYVFLVNENGVWLAVSLNAPTGGTLRLDQGAIHFFSQATGRTGTLTLYEVDGKRVLRFKGEGGLSFEVTRQ